MENIFVFQLNLTALLRDHVALEAKQLIVGMYFHFIGYFFLDNLEASKAGKSQHDSSLGGVPNIDDGSVS